MWQDHAMIRFTLASLLICVLFGLPVAAQTGAAARKCLSTAETVEAVRQHGLSSPALALRTAAAHARAEALRLVLCHRNGQFVYEVTLLRRDGKIMRMHVNASDGVLLDDLGLH
jgi:uncharacterized membrane protein YkoI